MKNVFTLVFMLLCFTAIAQKPKGMVKVEMPTPQERLDAFNQEAAEPVIDTITSDFRIMSLVGSNAILLSSHGARFYSVTIPPEFNPFGYILEPEREYRISLEVDKSLIDKYQTRGQTGIVEARLLWFTVSNNQLKRDMLYLQRLLESGYDRSPRN